MTKEIKSKKWVLEKLSQFMLVGAISSVVCILT
jgi:hypothetical protein